MRDRALLAVLLLTGCASQPTLTAVDTRSENVDHRRLAAAADDGGRGTPATYALAATEGYRMPQLYAGPPPVVGERDSLRELAPTQVCLQVVVDAEGVVERSVLLNDRPECQAGAAAENAVLVQAAQEAVAQWRYSPAAVCTFAEGKVPKDRGDCRDAARVEPVAVSLLYAFTFEIVKGQHIVRQH
ncbi:hypothetical protein [Stenotrophomonas sp.]|uniref:hypothetical protein n=1 Tax=Stenotrophomonas sp. TaxID=69392 RepID=UPI002896EB04|nr:hypothetical protein [Stenotrophomonas sp.]